VELVVQALLVEPLAPLVEPLVVMALVEETVTVVELVVALVALQAPMLLLHLLSLRHKDKLVEAVAVLVVTLTDLKQVAAAVAALEL
jgi:hypothetical protein